MLADEARGPAPHLCLHHAVSERIYEPTTVLARAAPSGPAGAAIVRFTAELLNTLIDGEVDGVVDDRRFANALVSLVDTRDFPGVDAFADSDDSRLVELLFGVANTIRLHPDILPAWFNPQHHSYHLLHLHHHHQQTFDSSSHNAFAGRTRRADFPLFYLLIDRFHLPGRRGDFARTGLLYLIEAAPLNPALDRWLVESDLATLMATGLGALYSSLARSTARLPPDPPDRPDPALDSFLSYLLFWQDTVAHCQSSGLVATLLDHFTVLFLRQLLYPSLLESSVDGGSTPAVLTYLVRILDAVHQPALADCILHFLLADAMGPAAAAADNDDNESPSLFNLVDLALLGLRSDNVHTVVASLRLVAVILRRHHLFARSLLRTIPDPAPAMQLRPVGALNAELTQLFSLAVAILPDDPLSIDHAYDAYMADASLALAARNADVPASDRHALPDYGAQPLNIMPDDALLQAILQILSSFFSNSTVTNLALTDAVISLASSNLISLNNWLLVAPECYHYGPTPDDSRPGHQVGDDIRNDNTADDDKYHDSDNDQQDGLDIDRAIAKLKLAYAHPSWSSRDIPGLRAVVSHLVGLLHHYRAHVPDFDALLTAQRHQMLRDPQNNPVRHRQPAPAPQSVTSKLSSALPPAFSLTNSHVLSTLTRSRPSSPAMPADSPQSSTSSRTLVPDGGGDAGIAADHLRKRLMMPFTVPLAPSGPDGGAPTPPPPGLTLMHVLTNVVLLYEFVLELTALVQVRASVFQEISFSR